jgi:hypothetical protein
MNDSDIIANHMMNRCCFLWVLFSVSLYDFFTYSFFEPFVNNFTRPYYVNCWFFMFYLGWDSYKMLLSQDRKILYRRDLLIHHLFASYLNLFSLNYVSIIGDLTMLMESISLFNFVSCKTNTLYYYRLACIFCIRLPISCFISFYYLDYIIIPYYKPKLGWFEFHHLITTCRLIYFFILYDVYMIQKLYSIIVNQRPKIKL